MSSATGGNKKSSGKSAQAYWARAQASKFSETHKAKRIARHNKRMHKKHLKLVAKVTKPQRKVSLLTRLFEGK